MSEDLPPEHERGAIAWMARHPIAANLLMLLLIIGGFWSAINVQKEVEPQYELDMVEIAVSYPGSSPAEVEQGILLPVEEAVQGIPGIKEMTSTAREGSGTVELELVAGADRMKTFQDIDQAVNRIRTFPDEAEEPEVALQEFRREVMEVALFGEVDVWTLRQLAEQVRDRLLSDPAITQVELGRVPAYVTHVEIPPERLRAHGLTLGEVAERIGRSSQDIPAGSIETSRGEILLRLNERKRWADELATIPIVRSDAGGVIRLGDLAEITDGFEEAGFHGQFNRQPSISLEIYRSGEQSPLDIAAAVESIVEELKTTLPPGVNVRVDSNQAEDFRQRLVLLLENGALAVVIVLLILGLFLEYRLAFWIMMGMVTAFIGGVLFLPFMGLSVNMVSMFGFLVVLGIVVDDAVVVGENIYERREAGMAFLPAAIEGAREMAVPVIISILTNIVAWVPVMFLPGTTGKYWWPLPAVIIVMLLVSLAEALFILPAHLGHSRQKTGTRLGQAAHRLQHGFSKRFSRAVDRWYRPLLGLCLRNRYITLSLGLALLLVTGGYGLSDHMGMIMMPEVAADEIEAGVRLPVGTTQRQAARVAKEVTDATWRMFEEHDLHEVAYGIKTNVRGDNFIDVEVVMRPPDEHDMSAAEVIALWRDSIGDIDGVDQITFEAERGPGGARPDIAVDLSHADIDTLARASAALVEVMEGYENTRDISDSYSRGKERLEVQLLPEGQLLGLDPTDVGQQVRDAFFGALATRHLRGINEVEIRVKLPEEDREKLDTFESLIIRTPEGTEVPLLDVARVSRSEAFASIDRRDGRRVVTVSFDVEPKRATGQVISALREDVLPALRADYRGLTWTFQGTDAEMRESTQSLWGSFALALAVIYALLAISFRSYLQPLIVLSAIPFGIVGAVMGHILLGFDLSLVSLMGLVALSGVVVNDALIMVDHANRVRKDTDSAFEAIHQAGVRRFRPILLTTATTFGGLAPIILETSRQAAHLVPMAISLGFGIAFATAIVLVIVPCLYMVLEDLLQLGRKPADTSASLGAG